MKGERLLQTAQVSSITGETLLPVAIPIKSLSKQLGLIVVWYDLNHFLNVLLANYTKIPESDHYIIDPTNAKIFSSSDQDLDSSLIERFFVNNDLLPNTTFIENYQGEKK